MGSKTSWQNGDEKGYVTKILIFSQLVVLTALLIIVFYYLAKHCSCSTEDGFALQRESKGIPNTGILRREIQSK